MACVWVDEMAGKMVANEAASSVDRMADELVADLVDPRGHNAAFSKVE